MTTPTWKVPLSDVLVDDELLAAASDAVRSGWWSMGPRVADFEARFVALTSSSHGFAVANGTAALHLSLLAVGCGPGDEVVLPSLNFVAAANAIANTGAKPVLCDVRSADDLNLAIEDLEAAVTPATKAIVALHYGGFPCEIEAVVALAERKGLALVEDAAHAPGALAHGKACGTFGAAGCFSFFSNKNMPVGEGGMIVTDDDEVAERIRLLRSHGMTTLTWDRHRGHAHAYDVVAQGFNYRLDEIRAAMAIVQLERLLETNAARGRIVDAYAERLHGNAGLTMPFRTLDHDSTSSYHLAVVVLPPDVAREALRSELAGRGIQTSVHYPPIHSFSLYAGQNERALPVTDDLAPRLLTLPLYGHMRPADVELVVDSLLASLDSARLPLAG